MYGYHGKVQGLTPCQRHLSGQIFHFYAISQTTPRLVKRGACSLKEKTNS